MKEFKIKNGEKIVFTGDSVTDDGRKCPVGEGLWAGVGKGFVRQIDNFINVFYPELLVHTVNLGVCGHTSRDLLNRYDSDIMYQNPDTVVILIGANDVWRQFDEPTLTYEFILEDQFRSNIVEMVNKSKAKNCRIVLMTPYFLEPNKEDPMRKKMDVYANIVRDVAKTEGTLLVDLQAAFDRYLKYRHPCYISWDRVHPSHIGSMIIAHEFLKTMDFDFDRLK